MEIFNGRKILFIDNELSTQRRLKHLFESRYGCYFTNTGKLGIEVFNAQQPDMVVCDVKLPDVTGLYICRELKASYPHLPFIFLSAYNNKNIRMKGLKVSADTYIDKALDDDEIFLRISNLIPFNKKELTVKNYHTVHTKNSLKKSLYDIFYQHYVFSNAQKKVDAPHIAKRLALSLRNLQRKLKKETGLTFTQHHLNYRLEQSKQLLQEGKTCSEVSEILCFSSSAYFSYCFKKQFNMTPNESRIIYTGVSNAGLICTS